jgi:predicted nucleic acid-binding protein
MSKVVLDAMVILNLAKCDALETIVEALRGSLVVGVLLERYELVKWPAGSRNAGQPFSLNPLVEAGWLERVELTADELDQFKKVRKDLRLGDGETEAFILCANRGWSLAKDDKSARKRMSRHNPKVTLVHSVELVERAQASGRLPAVEAQAAIEELERLGGGSPRTAPSEKEGSSDKDDG